MSNTVQGGCGMRRCSKVVLVMLALGVASGLTACSATTRVSAGDLADRVVTTIEARLGVRAEVDCGDDPVEVAEGTTAHCEIIDPKTTTAYPAVVTITDADGHGEYGVSLSVDPAEHTEQQDEGDGS